MPNDTHTILCGKCRVPVEGPAEPQDHDMITCPACGRSSNFKNVMKSVSAFVQEAAGRSLQESMRKAARGSKVMKFTGQPIPKGSHPFVVNLKL
jgi:hypothetical protein